MVSEATTSRYVAATLRANWRNLIVAHQVYLVLGMRTLPPPEHANSQSTRQQTNDDAAYSGAHRRGYVGR